MGSRSGYAAFWRLVFAGLSIVLAVSASAQARGRGGGMDGGGGGVYQPDYVDPQTVKDFIERDARRLVTTWVLREAFLTQFHGNGMVWSDLVEQDLRRKIPDSVRQQIWGPQGLISKMQGLQVEMRTQSSCLDRDGNHKQASIYATKPGAICLSLKELAHKLDIVNYKAQIGALIVHEVSHLTGLNEPEALLLQRAALVQMSRVDPSLQLHQLGRLQSRMHSWVGISRSLQRNFLLKAAGACNDIRRLAQDHHEMVTDYFKLLDSANLAVPRLAGQILFAEPLRMGLLSDHICSLDPSIETQLRYALYGLPVALAFKKSALLTLADYYRDTPSLRPLNWGQSGPDPLDLFLPRVNVTIPRLTSMQDGVAQMEEMAKVLEAALSQGESLSEGLSVYEI